MQRATILTDFSPRRYTDLELQKKAQLVIDKMTNNRHFPGPVPLLMKVIQGTAQYAQSLTRSKDGSKTDTVIKKNNRLLLQRLLYSLALYVNDVSDGEAAIILSAGFDIRKKWAKAGPLPTPTGLSVNYGRQSGSVIVRCDVIKKVKSYDFQYTLEPVSKDSIWKNVTTTKRTAKIEGLEKLQQYAFRVAGMSTDPSRNYTDWISKIVV